MPLAPPDVMISVPRHRVEPPGPLGPVTARPGPAGFAGCAL